MAKFAQYFSRFLDNNLFAQERWADRQQLLGELLAREENMTFAGNVPATDKTGKGGEEKNEI